MVTNNQKSGRNAIRNLVKDHMSELDPREATVRSRVFGCCNTHCPVINRITGAAHVKTQRRTRLGPILFNWKAYPNRN